MRRDQTTCGSAGHHGHGLVAAALRSYLELAALIDRIHERNRDTSNDDVLELAYQELDAYRAERDAN